MPENISSNKSLSNSFVTAILMLVVTIALIGTASNINKVGDNFAASLFLIGLNLFLLIVGFYFVIKESKKNSKGFGFRFAVVVFLLFTLPYLFILSLFVANA